MMRKSFLKDEAAACRELAKHFTGRPEEPFLLRIASAMDDLAYLKDAGVPDVRKCSGMPPN